MKKLLCAFLSFLLLFIFCGCGEKDNTSDTSVKNSSQSVMSTETSTKVNTSAEIIQNESSDTKDEELLSSKPINDISSVTESIFSSYPSVTSTSLSLSSLTSDNKDLGQSSVTSRSTSSSKPTSSTKKVGYFTVNDPENTRGLSNTRFDYSFGVAKNGKPHDISVSNQKRFNSMKNVEALALDTVSKDKRMYLTFDCGYEYKNLTGKILDTLKKKKVKAAFFVTLDYVKSNPKFVRRMISEGHIVGNHSATHPVFPNLSRTKMAKEIYSVDKYLKDNFDYTSPYFRFPAGAYSKNSLELVTSIGYKSIFWSIAYGDYDTDNQMGYDKALKTVTSRFHPGAVILLHAISRDNANILSEVIDTAHRRGYTFKTLDDYYN